MRVLQLCIARCLMNGTSPPLRRVIYLFNIFVFVNPLFGVCFVAFCFSFHYFVFGFCFLVFIFFFVCRLFGTEQGKASQLPKPRLYNTL